MAKKLKLRKQFRRAPRYRLAPQDNKVIRVSSTKNVKRLHAGEIVDLSATGVAFLLPRSLSPRVGQSLKMAFYIPENDEVTFVAEVRRLELSPAEAPLETRVHMVKVGVEFIELSDEDYNTIGTIVRNRTKSKIRRVIEHHYGQWVHGKNDPTPEELTLSLNERTLFATVMGFILLLAILFFATGPTKVPSWAENFAKRATHHSSESKKNND